MTRGIETLVRRGLVRRRSDPRDRRRALLSPSSKGRRLHAEVERVSRALEQELLRVLSPAELRMLDRVLDKLERRSARIFADRDAWRRIVHGTRRLAR